jgi:hypothetical protein
MVEGFFLAEILRAHSTLSCHQEKTFHDHDRLVLQQRSVAEVVVRG